MKILLLAAAVVLATGQDPPPAAVEDISQQGDSLLFTLLHQTGISQFCVSEALDQCSKQEKEGHFASLIQGMKGMMQEEIIPLLKALMSLHNTTTQDNSPPCHCKDFLDSGDSKSGVEDVFPSTDLPRHTTTQDNSPPRHCQDLLDSGDSESGLRDVFPDPDRPHYRVEVYCEQEIDGGGWTIFQRRSNGNTRQSFERTWFEYEEGFGEKTGEFWLGLKNIHLLTTMTQQEVRIDLEDYEGGHRWAKYGVFHVDPQNTNYRLTIDRYSGDAGDAMGSNNEAEFSTPDADHDTHDPDNCAARWRGGWWNKACGDANLNGYQLEGQYSASYPEGIWWHQWHGPYYSLKRTTMMVRPAPQPFF